MTGGPGAPRTELPWKIEQEATEVTEASAPTLFPPVDPVQSESVAIRYKLRIVAASGPVAHCGHVYS